MHDERPDQMTMIGLHKLASQFGDGLVPELYELLTRRARMLEENDNVTEFPPGKRARRRGILSALRRRARELSCRFRE